MRSAEKISALFDSSKFRIILLTLIIVIQLSYDTYFFVFEKMGQHSDETWSYSIANYFGEYAPYESPPEDGWKSSAELIEYTSASDGNRFGFSGTYQNSVEDLNPPLYYMLLHFICSFFPGNYNLWFAYIINILSVTGIQIYIYLTGCEIFREKKYLPFVCCVFFAVCRGSFDTAIFLRMYGMLGFFTISQVYYQIKTMHSEDTKEFKKNVILSVITCYCGFMTHSFYPMVGGTATFMVCLWFLFHKKIKRFFIHGFSMLGSLILYIVTFSAGLVHVLGIKEARQTRGFEYPYITQFRSLRNYVINPVTGIMLSVFDSYTPIYITAAIVIISAVAVPLCFLFRKETWFINAVEKVKTFFKEKKYLSLLRYEFLILVAVCLVYIAVAAKVVDIMMMGAYCERYIFNLFPLVCIAVCMIAYYVFDIIKPIRKAGVPCVLCAVIVMGIMSCREPSSFLINTPGKHGDIRAMLRGSKVQMVVSEPWVSVGFYPFLRDCEEFRVVSMPQFNQHKDDGYDVYPAEEIGDFYLVFPAQISKDNNSVQTTVVEADNSDSSENDLMSEEERQKYEKKSMLNDLRTLDTKDAENFMEYIRTSGKNVTVEEQCVVQIQGGFYSILKISENG